MSSRHAISLTLPPDASAALAIVEKLRAAGHVALLAGGCVRDLLLHHVPEDFDVATDATPERVCSLFRPTRLVGAQFGVVLAKSRDRWVEVATFRSDGEYADHRRPTSVTFGDARADALRRDFTINGLFYDPATREVVDFIGGLADLDAKLVRAIGDPRQRFEEDYLRLLRAVRFSARLNFPLELQTAAAVRAGAAHLAHVAPERVREELEKMFIAPSRALACEMLSKLGLLTNLSSELRLTESAVARAVQLVAGLPENASFAATFATLVLDRSARDLDRITRALAFSNEQRDAVLFVVAHQHDLNDPDAIPPAALKRLLASAHFEHLGAVTVAGYAGVSDGARRAAALERRIRSIPRERIAPPPLVTGVDLIACGVPRGPRYARILDALYTRQLAEELTTRDAALAALRELLARGDAT